MNLHFNFTVRRCPCVTDSGIIQILEKCTDLEELVLSQCLNLTDAVFTFKNEARHRHCLRKLESLDISECHLLTDSALESLAGRCSRLTSLCCSSLPLLTDNGVIALLQHCTNLQVFDCSHCDEISSETIQVSTNMSYLFILTDTKFI